MKITITIQEYTPHGIMEFAFKTDGRPAQIKHGGFIYDFKGIQISKVGVEEGEK